VPRTPHAPSAGVVAQRVAQPLQVRTDPVGELAAPAGRAPLRDLTNRASPRCSSDAALGTV
jgi:hypothetical protein